VRVLQKTPALNDGMVAYAESINMVKLVSDLLAQGGSFDNQGKMGGIKGSLVWMVQGLHGQEWARICGNMEQRANAFTRHGQSH
jgi:hypothetical protein